MDPRLSIDWDNIRVFLAALRAKSLRGVADELGLTHPTARRRLAVLEEQLGGLRDELDALAEPLKEKVARAQKRTRAKAPRLRALPTS